jgi:hypothetical protein
LGRGRLEKAGRAPRRRGAFRKAFPPSVPGCRGAQVGLIFSPNTVSQRIFDLLNGDFVGKIYYIRLSHSAKCFLLHFYYFYGNLVIKIFE